MSNIQTGGVGIDTYLALNQGGMTTRAATGLKENGTDIASIYAQASYGTATTGFASQSGGTDIGLLFARKGTAYQSIVHSTAGSGTETVPTGASSVTIEVWGGGGGGAHGIGSGCGINSGAAGGASGYCRSNNVAVSGGQTLNWTVGSGGAGGPSGGAASNGTSSTVSSGTKTITTMTGTFGRLGTGSTGGAGGVPSGGTTVNTTGTTGGGAQTSSTPATVGLFSRSAGAGGGSSLGSGVAGKVGGTGLVVFTYYS